MNPKIQEDIRTFKEFFPDPAMRDKVHRTFAHKFLPQYVHQNPYAFFTYLYAEKPQEPTRFIQSRWSMIFEETIGVAPKGRDEAKDGILFRRVSDLTMTIQEVAGKAAALVHMPIPEGPTAAFFVGVVLSASAATPGTWARDVQARVFTLEAEVEECPGQPRRGVLCEWTKTGEHRNYGVVPGQRDFFLQGIVAIMQHPDAPAAASWTPPKDGVPGTITVRGGASPHSNQP
jgi:hypothetical protein